jgi:DNA topoisomerase-3
VSKELIITEKPSVAGDIAKALGGFKRHDDYYESDRYVLASAVGHLLELTPPEGFEAPRGKWTFAHLPVIPPEFALRPIEKSQARLKLLVKLIRRPDVTALINACDAGREGELIFRYIVRYAGTDKPIKRLWLQSMTPAAIREGFQALRSDAEMQPLAAAAVCRSEADWLVGINGTRAMTAFNSKGGGFHKTTVGRVQTPTLAMIVEREQRIRSFVPRDYWEVIATFDAQAGPYTGRWFDEQFKKPEGKDADPELRAERIWDQAKAEAIQAKCLHQPGHVTEESKPATQLSPLLFDLTSLQREANQRFGFSAKATLGLAQALYEKHKVLTYPRTDSRHLPEDYPNTVRQTLQALQGVAAYAAFADKILTQAWVKPGNKRVFNDAKVSDHFAIIPTPQAPRHLTEAEQKIYDLVARRFLAIFYPPAEFLETTRITRVEAEAFKSVGKVLVKPGWLEVYGRETQTDDAPTLTPVAPDERVLTRAIEVKPLQTRPPARFTEATLLSAMEGAGKLVEDDDLREAMAEKGLGTPATRAAIIEGLIAEDYVHRQGKELVPTAKAFSLMVLLNGLGVEALTKPELTGEWEYQLKQMERARLPREQFMAHIRELTRQIVAKAKSYEHDTIPGDFGVLKTPCPKCGGEVHETYKKFQCQRCDFALWKIVSGRQFEPEEIEALIAHKQVGPLQGFRSRLGKPFAAVIKLTPEGEAKFDFGDESKGGEEGEAGAPVDFSGREPVGQCPKCGGRVFEHSMNYVCEHSVGAAAKCDFKMGAVILQQPVDRTQAAKLLATGKTDLLDKFVSKRNGRAFKAYLKLEAGGKVGFEFAPRESKGKARAAKPREPQPKLDFTGQEPLGNCPRCGGKVFETDTSYVCERTQADSKPCKFRSGKVVLHQPIERAQMAKLLATGRTDLLPKFISKAGRPFAAYLVVRDGGKVGFEFPDRADASSAQA